MLSTRTTRRLRPVALVVAVAALAVPAAHGKVVPAAKSVPLVTEHSAGQNGTGRPSTAQSVPLITEHSAGQNGTGRPKAASRSAAASVSAAPPDGFRWRDAGVGAGVAFGATLLAIGVATLMMRRGRGRLAGF